MPAILWRVPYGSPEEKLREKGDFFRASAVVDLQDNTFKAVWSNTWSPDLLQPHLVFSPSLRTFPRKLKLTNPQGLLEAFFLLKKTPCPWANAAPRRQLPSLQKQRKQKWAWTIKRGFLSGTELRKFWVVWLPLRMCKKDRRIHNCSLLPLVCRWDTGDIQVRWLEILIPRATAVKGFRLRDAEFAPRFWWSEEDRCCRQEGSGPGCHHTEENCEWLQHQASPSCSRWKGEVRAPWPN